MANLLMQRILLNNFSKRRVKFSHKSLYCLLKKIAGHETSVILISNVVEENLSSKEGSICGNILYESEITPDKVVSLMKNENIKEVIGIGATRLCDLTKITGWDKKVTLVPISLSSNGPFTHKAATDPEYMSLLGDRYQRGSHSVITGFPHSIIISLPYLLQKQVARFNHSGTGDVLAGITGIYDHQLALTYIKDAAKRKCFGLNSDPLLEARVRVLMEEISTDRLSIRRNSGRGLRILCQVLEKCAQIYYHAPRLMNGSEHSIAEEIYQTLSRKGKLCLHGETLSIGILLGLFLQDRSQEIKPTKQLLQELGLPLDYRELGLTEGELLQAIVRAKEARKDKFTVLNITGLNAYQKAVEFFSLN